MAPHTLPEFIPTLHELWQLAYAAWLVVFVSNALGCVFFATRFLIDGIQDRRITRFFSAPESNVVDLAARRQQLRASVTGTRIH